MLGSVPDTGRAGGINVQTFERRAHPEKREVELVASPEGATDVEPGA